MSASHTQVCRFDGISYSHADLEIAQRAACAIVPLYGTGDHGEQEAARDGKLWNDHPAVQGALRALHEARVGVSPAGDKFREGTVAVPENIISELRKLYRGLEMSASIMRDPSRTGRWAGAEKTAAAFARYAATAQSLHVLVAASAARQSNDMEGEGRDNG